MARRMWQRSPDGEIVRAPSVPEEAVTAPDPVLSSRPPGRAHLGLALRLGARDTYDYLGMVLLLSLFWVLLVGAGLMGGQAVGVVATGGMPPRLGTLLSFLFAGLGGVVLGSPITAGIFRYTRNAATRQEPELFDLAWGFRGGFRRALGLGSLQALGVLLLAGNCYFYLLQRLPVLVVVGAAFGYLLAFWGLASLYQWPLLVEQELTPVAAVKKSALLVLDNFFFTLAVGVMALLLTAICWVTMLGGVLLWAGMTAMLLTQVTRELLRKYGVLGPDPTLDPIAGETHELRGLGQHE